MMWIGCGFITENNGQQNKNVWIQENAEIPYKGEEGWEYEKVQR